MMDAFIIACLALRRQAEEKRIPEPEFQSFRLEFLHPVTETRGEPSSGAFGQFSETAMV
ncbi:MAG TPA: hypothetical protein VE242_02490 [Chthoniobacterales bacterium]|nr:hypothetical protein [Chthoniobacterales bacterium]